MLEAWAKAYADRWGLPNAAVDELSRVLDAAGRGELVGGNVATVVGDPPDVTDPPSIHDRLLQTADAAPDERYEEMGLIGEGGMGEVRRVWDNALHRSVAMKVLRRELAERDDLVQRFVEEAQATAQLEHPGIMPVYDVGRLPDGRPYFTMKEIRGRSLLDVIEELHQESDGGWGTTVTGWTFPRLIGVFQQVCEAVAFAHARGVLHRDLKPTNVMVGAFGEVVVMDWGLAKIAGAVSGTGLGQQVVTVRSRGGTYVTRMGSVAGTPNYMPPEQARGEHGLIGPWSDVYALGAILYEILADRAPYDGDDLDAVVAKVLAAPPPPPFPRFQAPGEGPFPEDALREVCSKAMSREIAARYMDAATLAEAVESWLADAGSRERSIQLVRHADAVEPDLVELRKRVATLRAEAASMLASLPLQASPERKRAAWALEDQAADIERELQRKTSRYTNLLQAALAGVPDLPEAANRLEALAEVTGTPALRHPGGDAWITVLTDPPSARVTLRRVQAVDRRLVPVPPAPAGTPGAQPGPWDAPLRAPIDRMKLPAGAWQLTIEAEGHQPLVVLAQVRPGELWSVTPPGSTRVAALRLARLGQDPKDTARIPAGWFWAGGDVEIRDSLPRTRMWVDTFLVRRHPVTNAEYLVFLDELARAGRWKEAAECAPAGTTLRSNGTHALPDGWTADEPVRRVTFDAAQAYAAWWSGKTGRAWRLPREREWEKAARGTDERLFPWGNFLDPSWCNVCESHGDEPPRPAPIGAHPLDVSPYGVLGLGGNVRDWVIDDRASRVGPVPKPFRLVKGGHWLGIPQLGRCALRYTLPLPADDSTGFRLVCAAE